MKTILTMSLAGSLLLLVVMAVRALLGERLHPRVLYALWLPVALCLLLPLRLPSAVSVLNAPAARRIDQAITQRAEVVRPEPTPHLGAPVQVSPNATAAKDGNGEGDATPAAKKTADRTVDGWAIARIVWGVGAAGMAAYILVVILRFALRVRRSRVPVDLPRHLRRGLGRIQVYCSRAVSSPCLTGLLRPCIVVTPAALESEERLEHVLAHERAHWRQGDAAFALLRFAALTVHWFNPLVWIGAAMSRTDCENACDALAIRDLGEARRIDYGKTLLAFLRARPTASGLMNAATTMAQGRRQIRRRINLIAKRQKYAGFLAALAIALVLTGCAVTITDAQQPDGGTPAGTVTLTPAPSAPPAQTPESTPEPDPYPEKVRAWMNDYEDVLAGHADGFADMTAEEALAAVPEMEGDFLCYGRKNAAGDAYLIAYLRPRPTAVAVTETHTTTAEIYSDTRYLQIEEYGEDEKGEYVKLRTYELNGSLSLSQIEDGYFLIVLNYNDARMIEAMDPGMRARIRYAESVGLAANPPEKGPYLEAFLLNDAMIAATGICDPLAHYLPLGDDRWQDIHARLEKAQVKAIDPQQDWVAFWKGIVRTGGVLHESEERSYALCTDRLLIYDGYDMTGIIEDEALVSLLHDLLRDGMGVDPMGFSLNWFNKGLSQATLQFPDHMDGSMRTQTLEDVDALSDLCALFLKKSQPMNGGSACPFGARLEATRLDGEKIVLYFASDSCNVFFKDGLYFEYRGGQEALLALFPDCAPAVQ